MREGDKSMSPSTKSFWRGFVVACLLAASTWAIAAWKLSSPDPPLSREQLQVRADAGFERVVVVEKIVEVPIEIPVEVPITERVIVEVPGREVEVIRTVYVDKPAPGIECPELGTVILGGGCELYVSDTKGQRHIKGWFDAYAKAVDGSWLAKDRRPIRPEEITYEMVRVDPEPLWTRRWWFGALSGEGTFGPMVSWSVSKRRWAAQLGAGALLRVDRQSIVDYDYSSTSHETEPVFFLQLSRRGGAL